MKPGAITHSRVSSSKQSQEGDSLDMQVKSFHVLAEARGWNILKEFRESYSGRKNVRPVWDEIIAYIKNNPGKIKYYLTKGIDRFTRGGALPYETMKGELAKYGVEMVDVAGLIQAKQNTLEGTGFEYAWSRRSNSEITELVLATTAKEEVTNILTRTIGQQINLTQQGYKVRSPQDGYLNKQVFIDGKRRVIQIPDPERAKYMVELFNLRAAGTHSDPEIVSKINAMGYRSRVQNRWDTSHERVIGSRGNTKLSVKKLQEIIKRPIYCGIVLEKWTRYQPVRAPYDGLVSIDTFNKANRGKVFIEETGGVLRILFNHHPENFIARKMKNNPLFPYKSVVVCPLCKSPFVGSSPRGKSGKKFPTYHCSRNHKYLGIPKKDFEGAIEMLIKNLHFRPEYLDSLELTLLNKYREREKEILQDSVNMHKSIADLKTEQKAKLDALVATTSTLVKQKLESEIEALEDQIMSANGQSAKIDVTEADIKLFIKRAKYMMEHLDELLLNPENPMAQRSLFGLVFKSIPTYAEIVNGTPSLDWMFNISSTFSPKESSSGVLGCQSSHEHQ